MPCDSRILTTKMLEHERLAEALRQLGYELSEVSENRVRTKDGALDYYRNNTKVGFSTSATESAKTEAVGMKYAELTARSWAAARGFVVQKFDQEAQQLTVIKRGGR